MTSLRAWLRGILLGGGRRELKELGVDELTSIEELDAVLETSASQRVAIFKHSTRCPISAAAYRQVVQYLEGCGGVVPARFYLVKVIESREVSSEIAARLGVPHQSPQLMLVNCKRAYWNASHGAISSTAIEGALR